MQKERSLPWRRRWACNDQESLRRLELPISNNTRTEGWVKVQGGVDPRFAAGLPFPVPEALDFIEDFAIRGKFSCIFLAIFPEVSLGTSDEIPGAATAFSSFLK